MNRSVLHFINLSISLDRIVKMDIGRKLLTTCILLFLWIGIIRANLRNIWKCTFRDRCIKYITDDWGKEWR